MRYLRLLLGAVVIVGALYLIVVEQMAGASSNAVVNAPVVTLRSPIAGQLDLSPLALGAVVTRDEPLAEIRDNQADRVRLNDLLMERDLALAELNRLRTVRDRRSNHFGEVSGLARAYREARWRELAAMSGEATSGEVPAFESDKVVPSEGLDRIEEAAQPLQVDPEPPRRGAGSAPSESQSVQQFRRDEVEKGTYLDGSANPVWSYQMRSLEASLALGVSDAELKEALARVTAYEARIERERERVNLLAGANVSTPVHGVLWERLVADGVVLQRGDPMLRIANCEAVLVTLSVTENVYNTLQTGDAATFRFNGSSQTMQGTVARLAGSGAATVYRELAVAPSQKHLERYDVTLLVPELRDTPEEGCPIGRTGRVFFDDRPLNFLRDLWN
ncbi:HlyD family secretion protein [Pseudooceanicola atlanticus]|uniref:HlyD family secretion protein n=1 Tax=Pseudooceanicola atlanticus TaxID=1461694 RepID=A0A0A0EN15_9RHOB|nr:HlyD family secretion protein [Pseudooceanicola atlanticus]KGM50597.1 hypothetical protein ATO9_03710 [Pseudooceanicola atlanticus]